MAVAAGKVRSRILGAGEECPACGSDDTRVTGTKPVPGAVAEGARRRYHACAGCHWKWRTETHGRRPAAKERRDPWLELGRALFEGRRATADAPSSREALEAVAELAEEVAELARVKLLEQGEPS